MAKIRGREVLFTLRKSILFALKRIYLWIMICAVNHGLACYKRLKKKWRALGTLAYNLLSGVMLVIILIYALSQKVEYGPPFSNSSWISFQG